MTMIMTKRYHIIFCICLVSIISLLVTIHEYDLFVSIEKHEASKEILHQTLSHSVHVIITTENDRNETNDPKITIPTSISTTKTIRKWGCNLSDAPFIFIHIGKAGGGNIRARLSASALDYNNEKKWNANINSYFPVDIMEHNRKAVFQTSTHYNFRANATVKTFERTLYCNATTPLGLIGCPEYFSQSSRGNTFCNKFRDEQCLHVYAGHNRLGSEMHWMTFPQIDKWWNETTLKNLVLQPDSNSWQFIDEQGQYDDSSNNISLSYWIEQMYNRNLNATNGSHCETNFQNQNIHRYNETYKECFQHLSYNLDQIANTWMMNYHNHNSPQKNNLEKNHPQDYSTIYQSLPVLRTTQLREPFSWFLSKFFWHWNHNESKNCTDLSDISWVTDYAKEFIIYLCGEDCYIRNELGLYNLDAFESQAENNLRHAIAIVGLLNETEAYYDMISKRVGYIDMSLNPEVVGKKHSSGHKGEYKDQCTMIFASADHRQYMMEHSPEVAALVRLFHVGIEVNRFQMQELESCA